jgi:hypothetical protein
VPSDLPHRWSAGLAGTWRHYRPSAPRSTLARASQKPDYHACGRFGSLPEKGPAAREGEAPALQHGCRSSRCRVAAVLPAAAPRSDVVRGRCSPPSPGCPWWRSQIAAPASIATTSISTLNCYINLDKDIPAVRTALGPGLVEGSNLDIILTCATLDLD